MRKKLIGVLLVGAMIIAQAMPVMAAGSATATPSEPDMSRPEVQETLDKLGEENTEVTQEIANAILNNKVEISNTIPEGVFGENELGVENAVNELNGNAQGDVKAEMQTVADAIAQSAVGDTEGAREVIEKLKADNTDAVTGFFDLTVDLDTATKVTINGEEKIPVAFEVPASSLQASTDTVHVEYFLVHYASTGEWELVPAIVDPQTGLVIGYFSSFSPVMLIAEITEVQPVGSGDEVKDEEEITADGDKSAAAEEKPAYDATGKSPKTSVQSDWSVLISEIAELFQ